LIVKLRTIKNKKKKKGIKKKKVGYLSEMNQVHVISPETSQNKGFWKAATLFWVAAFFKENFQKRLASEVTLFWLVSGEIQKKRTTFTQ